MKIIFTNRLTEYWILKIEELRKEFPNVEFITFKEHEHPRELLSEAEAVVGGHFESDEIKRAKNLKFIFVPWTGVNMLPWDVIRQKNITVTNTHANSKTVAERAVALALSLLGRIVEFHNDLKMGIWHGFPVGLPESDFWTSLHKKTCAIVGFGSIGKHIAKMLKAFECHVIAFKKHPVEEMPEYADEVLLDLKKIIDKANVIFVSIPLTAETKGMFDKEILFKMKGKFLINVSRGEILEEKALYESLKNGILAGVAIDTWYQYPNGERCAILPSKYPIHTLKNVVLSPHIAGVTKQNIKSMADDTVDIIRNYLKNGEIRNRVDPQLMY